jgi:hypothetical protein
VCPQTIGHQLRLVKPPTKRGWMTECIDIVYNNAVKLHYTRLTIEENTPSIFSYARYHAMQQLLNNVHLCWASKVIDTSRYREWIRQKTSRQEREFACNFILRVGDV